MKQALYLLIGLHWACACGQPARPSHDKSLIMLGVDGMDPQLARQYMAAGQLPNFKRLAESGGFVELGTTDPPQSPVAWSAFITGLGHGHHGIYDFIHRDPVELTDYLSTSRQGAPRTFLGFTVSDGDVELLRKGEAFWQRLEHKNVPATVDTIPSNYPPVPTEVNESSSGMGTPDLLGGYGTYHLFTTNATLAETGLNGGIVSLVTFTDDIGTAAMTPPVAADPTDIDLIRDTGNKQLVVRLAGSNILLRAGEWSEWTPVDFPGGLFGGPRGIVRFFLRSVDPLHLYMSPINADPFDSELEISSPPQYARELANLVGRFYTQGMAEETNGLSARALSDEEFLAQRDLVFEERANLLRAHMQRFTGGLLFFYFSTIDLTSHMYYGAMLENALPQFKPYAHVVPETYKRMDAMLGEVLQWAGDRPVVVMSDHGFAPWLYRVNLNTWLAEQGYLTVLPPDQVAPGRFGHIDWDNTQAYSIGFNQLFINLRGREAQGVVDPAERELLMQRLKRDLESWTHSGERVVTEVMKGDIGEFPQRAPDLMVGYNRGFRSSNEGAQGEVAEIAIAPNRGHWNGDHLMHSSHVPGVLFSSLPLLSTEANLLDLAPSILSYFSVTPPEAMTGKAVW